MVSFPCPLFYPLFYTITTRTLLASSVVMPPADRPVTYTVHPCSPKVSAIPLPIPLDDPVTTATLPSRPPLDIRVPPQAEVKTRSLKEKYLGDCIRAVDGMKLSTVVARRTNPSKGTEEIRGLGRNLKGVILLRSISLESKSAEYWSTTLCGNAIRRIISALCIGASPDCEN